MIDKTFIKRRYSESRIGAVVINPILQASNFIMLAYIVIENVIPFWLFVPLFVMGMVSLVTFTGFKFRNIQLSTDEDIKYEKQTKLNRTLLNIMLAIENGGHTDTPEFKDAMREVKEISEINFKK